MFGVNFPLVCELADCLVRYLEADYLPFTWCMLSSIGIVFLMKIWIFEVSLTSVGPEANPVSFI